VFGDDLIGAGAAQEQAWSASVPDCRRMADPGAVVIAAATMAKPERDGFSSRQGRSNW